MERHSRGLASSIKTMRETGALGFDLRREVWNEKEDQDKGPSMT